MLFNTITQLWSTCTRRKHVLMDMYTKPEDFDMDGALSFPRESPPTAFLAVMVNLQDRIADATLLVSNMATAKDAGLLSHAAGQLNALQELWDDIEARRAEAVKLSIA